MYQIHKDRRPIGNSSEILGATCADCVQTTDGRYMVEVDIFDKVVRRFTFEERQQRADKFLHPLGH